MNDYDPYLARLARTVNDGVQTLANLATRKALRGEPHKRGWLTRKGEK